MVARISTLTFQGIHVRDVDVQVQMSNGFVAFNIVGLPDKAVAESRERVRAALHAIGLSLPAQRITVNLAPADLLKEGSHFDLPIALALMTIMGVLPRDEMSQYLALGELGLDGTIAPVGGILPAAIHAQSKSQGIICPEACGAEAAWASEIQILAAPHLLSLVNHFKGVQLLEQPTASMRLQDPMKGDMSDIKGQESAKFAMEIAAAGGHNILLSGPPGSGKSMLASRLISILPPLSPAEALETSMIHSVAGKIQEGKILAQRPYRTPHHTASTASLVGGGQKAMPGEISLAHNGVLFLDELPEFGPQSLEALRQPLEVRNISVSRANHHITYPANIQLVAAMNPCKCGHLGDNDLSCNRAPKCGIDYQNKISGPIYDRIDCHIDVPAVSPMELGRLSGGESSAVILGRVMRARDIQLERYKKFHPNEESPVAFLNCHADGPYLESITQLDDSTKHFLMEASEKFKLSARGYHRILRLARSLADLEMQERVLKTHISQALHFRRQHLRRPQAA